MIMVVVRFFNMRSFLMTHFRIVMHYMQKIMRHQLNKSRQGYKCDQKS